MNRYRKRNHYVRFINSKGYELGKVVGFSNNRKGTEIITVSEKIENQYNLKKVVFDLEPSDQYWKPMAYYLSEKGYPLVLVNLYHIKKTKELIDNSQAKTDIKDRLLVTEVVRYGNFFYPNLANGTYTELLKLSRLSQEIKKAYVREKIRLLVLLNEYIPEYQGIFSDIVGKTSIYILKNYFLSSILSREEPLKYSGNLKKISRRKMCLGNVAKLIF